MFGNGMQKNKLPLIIVCDDKDMLFLQAAKTPVHS